MSKQVRFYNPDASRSAGSRAALALVIFVFTSLLGAGKNATASSSPASFVQANATSVHGLASSLSAAFSTATTAGDAILVAFDYNTHLTVTAVTDSQGNAYSLIGSPITSPGGTISTIYYANKIKGGLDTVTVKLSANSPVIELYLAEYHGLNATSPIDAHVGATGSTSAVSSGAAATTVAGDIIFGYCLGDQACSAGAGFATRSTMDGNLIEDMVAGKAGAYAATGSATSTWTMKMVALKAATIPVVSLSPSSLAFASQAVGMGSAAQVVTLSNTGTAALSLSSIALTGANAGDFAQTNTCGSSLAAGAKCTVSATFNPTATGTRLAAVTLTDNATGSPQTVSLTGTGTAAIASLSPSSLTFGNDPVGTTSSSQVVTLNNTGNAALNIKSIAFTGANATDFTQVDTCGASVAAGGNCTIAILFTPSATGTRVASLGITDNASGSPQAVALSGTGTQAAPAGHTYYVDNCVVSGSDANNGTSPATPWLTINKVNMSTFNPGDSILFESTCTWREQLTVPSSGSAGSPITFGSYGTGAQPIISGANLVTSWVSESPLYYGSVVAQATQVFRDNQRLTLAPSKAALATGQWWWDSVNSRVYVYDNPSGHTMEASVRDENILVQGRSYVTLDGLQLDKGRWYGAQVTGAATGSANFTIQNSTVSHCYDRGINGWDAVYSNDNFIIEDNEVYDCGAFGITWTMFGTGGLISGNDIHDNAVLDQAETGDSEFQYTAGIDNFGNSAGISNITIEYNSIHDNGRAGQPDTNGAGIWNDSTLGGNIIRYNLVYNNAGNGVVAECTPEGGSIYGNVIYNNGNGVTGGGFGLFLSRGDQGWNLYNNTLYGNQRGLAVADFSGISPPQNNQVKNNLTIASVSTSFTALGGGEANGNSYLYNDFGPAGNNFIEWGSGVFESAYSAWETAYCGTSGCSHSVQADPQFVNASAAEFWLQSGSPAIDAGTNLGSPYNIGLLPGSSWPNSVVTGDQNSYGTGWVLGAYIFTGQTVQ